MKAQCTVGHTALVTCGGRMSPPLLAWLVPLYRREAALRGCAFPDAGQIISSSGWDGLHFEADAHQALGYAVARLVRGLLGA
jgi:lysophospholipase L1-like esterase